MEFQEFQEKPKNIKAIQWDGTEEGAMDVVNFIVEVLNDGARSFPNIDCHLRRRGVYSVRNKNFDGWRGELFIDGLALSPESDGNRDGTRLVLWFEDYLVCQDGRFYTLVPKQLKERFEPVTHEVPYEKGIAWGCPYCPVESRFVIAMGDPETRGSREEMRKDHLENVHNIEDTDSGVRVR